MKREDLELYAMGEYDGDVAALEEELARDEAARAAVADEAHFELLLRDAAAAATFCAACDDLVRGARCDACGAAVRPGGYAVERVLVSNAHGRMYAARDADGKQVALKELAFVHSPSVEVIAAFEREVKFLRALEHPAIPRFCASFEEGAGVHVRYYLAQELVAGESLADRLESHWFSEAEIVDIARQVLDVLVYLQGLSPMVIHRDIKPANLVVRADGSLAVVDFGAAHVQGMTVGSTAIGTFGYMPIEQLAGEVGPTTDLYALGASLLHLLTRKEPWRLLQGTALAGADANLSRPMRAFLGKLVAPEPRQRFCSAAEARAALDRLGTRRLRAAQAATRTPARAGAWSLPRQVAASALALAALAVPGFAALAILSGDDAPDRGAKPEPALASSNRDPAPAVANGDPAPAPAVANGAPGSAVLEHLTAFERQACACVDRACADDVMARYSAWTDADLAAAFAAARAGAASPPETAPRSRINGSRNRMMACIRRARSRTPGEPVDPITAGATPVSEATVALSLSAMSIHDVASALAASCRLNLVVAGSVDTTVVPADAVVPCREALEDALDWSKLDGKSFTRWAVDPGRLADHVVRIGLPRESTAADARRDARARRGLVDDVTPLPHGSGGGAWLDRVPLRVALQSLADDGGVEADIADSVGGRVSVFVRNVPWDVTLAAVLDATGLGYRYNPKTRRLRLAPIEELDAARPSAAPVGFLDVDVDTLRGDTLVIDGTVAAVPPGMQVPVRAGKRTVEIRAHNRSAVTYAIDVVAGDHLPFPSFMDIKGVRLLRGSLDDR